MPDEIWESVKAAVEVCKNQPPPKDIGREENIDDQEHQEDQKSYGSGRINATKTDTQKSMRGDEKVVPPHKAKKINELNRQVQQGEISQQDAQEEARAIMAE